MSSQSLKGKGILITRQRNQSSDMKESIERRGGRAFLFPVIEIVPVELTDSIKGILEQLHAFKWIIFASSNGVESFFRLVNEAGISFDILTKKKLVAVGTSTAKKIESFGMSVHTVPEEFTSEGLMAALRKEIRIGDHVLLPKADIGREIIANGLRSEDLNVIELVVYRTVPAVGKRNELISLLEKDVDIITFTSSSTVNNFVSVLGEENIDRLHHKLIACIGPKTAQTAEERGLHVSTVATIFSIDGLMDAITNTVKS